MLRLKNSTFFNLALAPIVWMLLLSIPMAACLHLLQTTDIWTSTSWSKELGLLGAMVFSIGSFALPLACFSAGRRSLKQLHPRYWWGWTQERYYGLSAWQALAVIFIVDLVLMIALGVMSEWIIEQLPSSWGIAIEDAPAEDIKQMITRTPIGYLLMFTAFALVPAVVEEVFFRGYIQRVLYSWTGGRPWLSIIPTALIFSAVHLSWVGFVPRLSSGLFLGWVYQRTGGRLMPVILVHMLGNTIALLALLME